MLSPTTLLPTPLSNSSTNLFNKLIYLTPVLIIFLKILFLRNYNLGPEATPLSIKDNFLKETTALLYTANLNPLQITHRDYQNELEFYLQNSSGRGYPVIFSTTKDPLIQVTALQKIIKIANIKEQEINFIDLSAQRPYATL